MSRYNIEEKTESAQIGQETQPSPIGCQDVLRQQQEEIEESLFSLSNMIEPFLKKQEENENIKDSMEYPSCFQGSSMLSEGFKGIYRHNETLIKKIDNLIDKLDV